jgi:glycosyltransferase involved in cell wall biosynthesis
MTTDFPSSCWERLQIDPTPMGIYVLVSGDFTPWGGMDRANYELAWHLAQRVGAQVHLVSHYVHPQLVAHVNVIWHRVAKPLNSYQLAGPLLARKGYQVARRLQEQGARVVVNGGNCPWPDVTWVHAVHSAWDNRDAAAPVWFRLKNRWAKVSARRAEANVLPMARVVIANSQQTRQQLIKRLGISPERVHVVYLGIDATAYRPFTDDERVAAARALGFDQDRPHAAFIGALGYDRNKGFDVLFATWQRLCQDIGWDVDLVVVGAGAELSTWQERVREAGLAERIHFLGFRKDVPQVLAACDVLVHPAQYEAYGLSVHEALCRGLPALVSAGAGVAERYPPELQDLLIAEAEDPAVWADRLMHWRRNREKLRTAVIPLSNSLRRYGWDHMAKRIFQILQAAA